MEKNEIAESALYEEVEGYLRWLSYHTANAFLRKEDILSYGWQGYIEAMDDYKEDSTVTFKSFMQHCIRRRLIDVQRVRNKRTLKAHMIGMPISEESVKYVVESRKTTAVSDAKLMMRDIWNVLSERERQIIVAVIMGKTRREIALEMSVSTASIYSTVRKIRKLLEDEIEF